MSLHDAICTIPSAGVRHRIPTCAFLSFSRSHSLTYIQTRTHTCTQAMLQRIDHNRLQTRAMLAACRLLQFWYRHPDAFSAKRRKRSDSHTSSPALARRLPSFGAKNSITQHASLPEKMLIREHLFRQLCSALFDLHHHDGAGGDDGAGASRACP